jgi:5-methylcytosine-specific restriction endonuclease McrA
MGRTNPKLYRSNRWKRLRKKVLMRDEFSCLECGRPANQVDHIVALRDGGEEFDQDNLQSLCNSCHSIKTAKEVGRSSSDPLREEWRQTVKEVVRNA